MKAGVYIVKDLFSEQKYILSLNGKEPFIRITNSISLSSLLMVLSKEIIK